MNSTVKADAQFLRRVFFGLVALTAIAGGLAAYTTVQAMTAQSKAACIVFCQ